MPEEKTIYDLKLHEGLMLSKDVATSIGVLRVPGGWLYQSTYGLQLNNIFVPYNEEFKEVKK